MEKAEKAGIRVAAEYHRRTLTQDAGSALRLLEDVPELYTYWQPNPEISPERNLEELRLVSGRLLNVHVFQSEGAENIRHPLADGEQEWRAYIAETVKHKEHEHHFLMEFVKDNDPGQFLRDAKVLDRLVRETVF